MFLYPFYFKILSMTFPKKFLFCSIITKKKGTFQVGRCQNGPICWICYLKPLWEGRRSRGRWGEAVWGSSRRGGKPESREGGHSCWPQWWWRGGQSWPWSERHQRLISWMWPWWRIGQGRNWGSRVSSLWIYCIDIAGSSMGSYACINICIQINASIRLSPC